jgi:2-polyprenyl-3-methyl-5-hydroxy-6-metoxy-1,4-benzoquinol methylase
VLRKILSRRRFDDALDVGCGEGFLRTCGVSNTVGIDLSHGESVNVIASAEHLPFREGSFALVFAGEVLEHTNEPWNALREWVLVLEPTGMIIVSTPNGLLISLDNPQHQHAVGYRALVKAMDKLGLACVSKSGVFTGLISGRRILRRIRSERMKRMIMRIPVPVTLSYDYFATFQRRPTTTSISPV